jgi:hypothetical protein
MVAYGTHSVFTPNELADMQTVIDAVCIELGLGDSDKLRREAIAERVMTAYRGGRRLPLNMVNAGLSEPRQYA